VIRFVFQIQTDPLVAPRLRCFGLRSVMVGKTGFPCIPRREFLAAGENKSRMLYRLCQPLGEREADAAGSAGDQVDSLVSKTSLQSRRMFAIQPARDERLNPAVLAAIGDYPI
jgi:hypothetical protein